MTRPETLDWIDLILDSLDDQEMLAIIRESMGQFEGEFFATVSSELARYETEHNQTAFTRLTRIARAIASVRQNQAEKL